MSIKDRFIANQQKPNNQIFEPKNESTLTGDVSLTFESALYTETDEKPKLILSFRDKSGDLAVHKISMPNEKMFPFRRNMKYNDSTVHNRIASEVDTNANVYFTNASKVLMNLYDFVALVDDFEIINNQKISKFLLNLDVPTVEVKPELNKQKRPNNYAPSDFGYRTAWVKKDKKSELNFVDEDGNIVTDSDNVVPVYSEGDSVEFLMLVDKSSDSDFAAVANKETWSYIFKSIAEYLNENVVSGEKTVKIKRIVEEIENKDTGTNNFFITCNYVNQWALNNNARHYINDYEQKKIEAYQTFLKGVSKLNSKLKENKVEDAEISDNFDSDLPF